MCLLGFTMDSLEGTLLLYLKTCNYIELFASQKKKKEIMQVHAKFLKQPSWHAACVFFSKEILL